MAFNSYIYLLCLGILAVVYRFLSRHTKAQNALLLAVSYGFYACWDWRFLSLILISTFTDFYVAQRIEKSDSSQKKRWWLSISILVNLGLLGVFKYFNFFIYSAEQLLNSLGMQMDYPTLNIILPVGISFYTFQTLSYTIDVYRGKSKPTYDLLNFSLYVTFFPQLVAGPIERPSALMPQIENAREVSRSDIAEGLHHILLGLFKKVVVADNMAIIVDGAFAKGVEPLNGVENWLGLVAFAFQIYGDFSGYSSIAQGSAKLLGFNLSYNFHMPYFAKSPSDFWARWHVTLSQWLRDYVYIPLGGNRGGTLFTYRNLILTMLLGGLWHGAGWNFVIWGLYHGLILCAYRLCAFKINLGNALVAKLLSVVATLFMFKLTLIGWMLFRLDNVAQISDVFWSLYVFGDWSFTPLSIGIASMICFLTVPIMVYEYVIYRNENDHMLLFKYHWIFRALLYSYFLNMMAMYSIEAAQEFIYFQF